VGAAVGLIANDEVMANDLSDLDRIEGGPQPAQGRELVIVDLRDLTSMAGASGRCLGRRYLAPLRNTGLGLQRRSGRTDLLGGRDDRLLRR
jgi:hypothetical protein